MWKAPHRPKNEVSQTFNDGIVTVFSVEDTAKPGYQPKETPKAKGVLRYEEQRLGIQRYYAGKQNQIDIQRVIRVPKVPGITSQDIAVTEDGQKYRIDLIQAVKDVWPACLDLTLRRYEQGAEDENLV